MSKQRGECESAVVVGRMPWTEVRRCPSHCYDDVFVAVVLMRLGQEQLIYKIQGVSERWMDGYQYYYYSHVTDWTEWTILVYKYMLMPF